jgi:hypothetical protein
MLLFDLPEKNSVVFIGYTVAVTAILDFAQLFKMLRNNKWWGFVGVKMNFQ